LFLYSHIIQTNLVLLMIGRVVNVLIPRQLGIVTDELTGESGQPRNYPDELSNVAKMPWVSLLVYVFLRFLQGNMGLVGALRSYAWIPIGQVPPLNPI
jgi:ATP-binding cassette, subfamily B, vacuolar membrane transporter HMT1/ACLQ